MELKSKEKFVELCINEASNGGSITYVQVAGMPYEEVKNFCYVNFLESWFDSKKNAITVDGVKDAVMDPNTLNVFGMKYGGGAYIKSWNLQVR